jgi:hypothetical protein
VGFGRKVCTAPPPLTPHAYSQPVNIHGFTRELHTSVRCDVRLAWWPVQTQGSAHSPALSHNVQSRSSFSLLAQCPIATLTTSAARHPDKLVLHVSQGDTT